MLITLVGLCIILDVMRDVLFKLGAMRRLSCPGLASRLWPAAGALVWAVELVLWAEVLTMLALNVALPLMSLTYALAPLVGRLLFAEAIGPRRWLGIMAVTLGSAIVGVATLK